MSVRIPIAHSALFLTLALSACTSDILTGPQGENRPEAVGGVPLCQAGCLDTDPNPDSAGVFIGATNTDLCTEGTDIDLDGLIDFCEKNLIQAFAPELNYSSADETGREPKWAAQWMDDSTVRLMYLLSYYRDAGSSAFVCSLPPPFPVESCFGHNGDSEHLALDVTELHPVSRTPYLGVFQQAGGRDGCTTAVQSGV